jgi:hypothetical protein
MKTAQFVPSKPVTELSADQSRQERLKMQRALVYPKTGQAMGSRSFVKRVQLIDKDLFRYSSTRHPRPNPERVNASHLKIDGFHAPPMATSNSPTRGMAKACRSRSA